MNEINASVVKRVQLLDKILMCMLYVIQACALGFIMAYLLDKGCTSSEVGVLSAGFAILTAIRRGDKLIPMRSAWNRMYVALLPLIRFYRHGIYPQYVRFLAPIVRKIKK